MPLGIGYTAAGPRAGAGGYSAFDRRKKTIGVPSTALGRQQRGYGASVGTSTFGVPYNTQTMPTDTLGSVGPNTFNDSPQPAQHAVMRWSGAPPTNPIFAPFGRQRFFRPNAQGATPVMSPPVMGQLYPQYGQAMQQATAADALGQQIQSITASPTTGSPIMPPLDTASATPQLDRLAGMNLQGPVHQKLGPEFGQFGYRNPMMRDLAVQGVQQTRNVPGLGLTRQGTALPEDMQAAIAADMAQQRSSMPMGREGFMPGQTTSGQPIAAAAPAPPRTVTPLGPDDIGGADNFYQYGYGQNGGARGGAIFTNRPPPTYGRSIVQPGVFGGARLVGPGTEDERMARRTEGIQRRLARQGRTEMEGVSAVPSIADRVQQQAADNPGRLELAQERTGRTFGVPRVGAPTNNETEGPTFGKPASLFPKGYTPPTVDGNVDPTGTAAEAVSFLENFKGNMTAAQSQLGKLGVTWSDIRKHAMQELYPGNFEGWDMELGPAISPAAREERDRRYRQYEALRKLDPTLPEWPWWISKPDTADDVSRPQASTASTLPRPTATGFGTRASRTQY